MRISRRGLALILSSLALVDVALGQVQAPSETSQDPQPPQTAPPVEKTPTLPKMQVVAPPKKKDATSRAVTANRTVSREGPGSAKN